MFADSRVSPHLEDSQSSDHRSLTRGATADVEGNFDETLDRL
jgi:hypothetical protein